MKRYKQLYEKQKASFFGVCDSIRQNSKGEKFWQLMMKTKKEISEKEFLKKVDLSKLLDEDETWKEYKETLEDIKYYDSDNAYFFQTEGFEFIFSK